MTGDNKPVILVQIPLWTIRTIEQRMDLFRGLSSDSSMDDKDIVGSGDVPGEIPFRFLYGR